MLFIINNNGIYYRPKETKEKKKETKSKGLPAVPESVLKHRKRREALRQKTIKSQIKKRAAYISKRKEIFKRAEKYVKEYRLKERDEIRLIRQAKTKGNYYIPGEAKLAFVVRIRGYVLFLLYFFNITSNSFIVSNVDKFWYFPCCWKVIDYIACLSWTLIPYAVFSNQTNLYKL